MRMKERSFGISFGGNNMLKCIKCLQTLLKIVSITTFFNVIVIYWVPINVPISSFSAIRVMFVALIEKKYYLIAVSALICLLLFLSAVSIRKKCVILPALSLAYLIYDSIVVLLLLIDGFNDGYWKVYIIQAIVTAALVVLLCIYWWNFLRDSNVLQE